MLNFVHFIRHIRHIGAVAPSSPFLAEKMIQRLRMRVKTEPAPLRVLELGPGTGAITRFIAPLIRAQDRLDIVEIDTDFCSHIRDRFQSDRISIHGMDVLDFRSDERYDFIISSIPYDQLPQEVSTAIWKKRCRF